MDAESGSNPEARQARDAALQTANARVSTAKGLVQDAAASPVLFALGGASTAGSLAESAGKLAKSELLETMGRNLRTNASTSRDLIGSTDAAAIPFAGGAIAANLLPYAGAAKLAPWAAKGAATALAGRTLASAPVDAVQAVNAEGSTAQVLGRGARAFGAEGVADVLDKASTSYGGRLATEVLTNAIPDAAFTLGPRTLRAAAASNAKVLASETGAVRLGPSPKTHSDPDVAAVLSTIGTGDRRVRKPPRWLSRKEQLYTQLVDEAYPLKKAGSVTGGGESLTHTIRQEQGWAGAADQYLDDALRPIVEGASGRLDEVMALAKVRRDLDLRTRGVASKTDIPEDVLLRTMTKLEADPDIAKAADGLTGFYRGLLALKRDAGVLSPAQYDEIVASEDYYSPFLREWDARMQTPAVGGSKWAGRGAGVRKMDREAAARAKTTDPFEAAILDTRETFRRVAKQKVTNAVTEAVERDPDALAGVIRPVTAETTGRGGEIINLLHDGSPVAYEVVDRDFYNAFAAFDPIQRTIFGKLLGGARKSLQTGVTILPDFAVANLIRDNAQVAVQNTRLVQQVVGAGAGAVTGAVVDDENRVRGALLGAGFGTGAGVLLPQAYRTMQAVADIAGGSEVYREFLRQGGSTHGYYGQTKKPAEILREMRGLKPSIVKPSRWWGVLQAIGNASEQAPRLATFKQATANGATATEAISQARDVSLNFAQSGSGTKGVTNATAFWNPKVQGWDKLSRMLKDPKTATAAAAALTAPTIALWNVNKDNPEYWERPLWERNAFWLIPREEGGFWRMPKPFELGFLFASLPERFLDFQHRYRSPDDGDPGETLRHGMQEMGSSTLDGIVPMPNAMRPVIEQAANYDFFRGRPIVPNTRVAPAYQYDERTSAAMRALGQLTGASPQRLEHMVRSTTGGLGGVALDLADRSVRAVGGESGPVPSDQGPPVVGLLTKRFTTKSTGMTETEAGVRRRAEGAQTLRATLRKVGKEDPEKAAKMEAQAAGKLAAGEELIAIESALRELASERRAVALDRSRSSEKRKADLEALDAERRALAKEGLRLRARGR
ncbi:MAG: LPD38 domain-containing protein [Gemmatimonadales bacterium]|nr:LPD38 domain-containing protein [Gemmatimonadales bacterium]